MRRRDLLTYDVDQRRRPLAELNPRLLALLAVVLIVAALLVIWTATSAGSAPRHTVPATAGTPTTPPAASRPTSASPSAGVSSALPTLTGSDAVTSHGAPAGSTTAAARFVAAWLDVAPKTRKVQLEQTATAGLAEQLMLTSAANIPKAKAAGSPRVEDASEYSVQFLQVLTDGVRIRIYLVADPQARFGWVATSVEQA
ncbi:hypothetical protein GCM10011575_35850 [Microlunatus endophyticus]|uniref:Uncharacterized protein n=1 Tax=Microlunatus endophyticus TaxID=1716077 RepID=A0A917SFX0_9ACTN|nr:hypothetical protein [Microlunatus endophyticus]GGL74429.1 hypothetical protein GCM10011575_35850 [Microlunatus endophyticus]